MKKRICSFFMAFVLCFICFDTSPFDINASAAGNIETALKWAIAIANDNSHGYSQENRTGPDYDCSSLVCTALKKGGFSIGSASYTGNMRKQLTQNGFTWIPWSKINGVSNLKRGDILLWEGHHTEFYIGNNKNVGAHGDYNHPETGDQNGKEISVTDYWYDNWDGVLRYNVSTTVTFYRNLDSSDTYKVRETFTAGVSNQKFGYDTNGNGRYSTMHPADVGFGAWSKPGYDMLGWSKDRNASAASWKTYSGVIDSWIINNNPNVDLYAVWRPHVYTVSFSSDDQLLSNKVQVTYGTKYGTLPTPEKEDAIFDGWYTADGTLITSDSVYTATVDQTLFAHWTPVEKKTIGDANGDGNVNMKDFALLKRYLNNWDVEIDLSVCDLNDDGNVNMKDLALLRKKLNN